MGHSTTRHTLAIHWVMDGGSIEELRRIMSHCSAVVTERCVHLSPDVFSERARQLACVDLTAPAGAVINLGTNLGTDSEKATGTDS